MIKHHPMRLVTVALAVIAVAVALAIAGCGPTKHHVSSQASAAAKADARQGEPIVGGCMKTHTTANAIYQCVVPKGSGLQLKRCVLQAVAAHSPLTGAGRAYLEGTALPQCVEKYR